MAGKVSLSEVRPGRIRICQVITCYIMLGQVMSYKVSLFQVRSD